MRVFLVAFLLLVGVGAMAKDAEGGTAAGHRGDDPSVADEEVMANCTSELATDSSTNSDQTATLASEEKATGSIECGIWLAPSTIPDSGMGMFAGRGFREGQDVGSGDPVVAVWDFRNYHPEAGEFLPFEYTWDAWYLKMLGRRLLAVNTTVEPTVNAWSPGLGSAANSDRSRVNIRFSAPTLDSTGVHESRGPGTGAFTYYQNRRGLASTNISAGQELFVDYGEPWFRLRGIESGESPVPSSSSPVGYIDTGIKDEAWLRKNGVCGDHLVAGTSSIPQAGRGAFAGRHLPAGTLVAQLPLVHILRKSLLDMYSMEGLGRQLLLNYCFGHRKSTLLLCPYGPMTSLINHGTSRQGNNFTEEGATANVRMQWSDPARSIHNSSLLLEPIQALQRGDKTAKLAMDLVATRDIAEGEEVLLDYGVEWEQAWESHIEQWDGSNIRQSAERLDDKTTRIRTVFELLADNEEYPENVELFCDSTFRNSGWRKASGSSQLDIFLSANVGELVPCDVLRYEDVGNGTVRYTAAVYGKEDDESYLLEDIPRQALSFRDVPYTTDDFASNVFRHDIRIPDELFPEAWRNRR